MCDTSLLVFFVVILGTTWAQTTIQPKNIFIRLTNRQGGINFPIGQAPTGDQPSTGSEVIVGSEANQTGNNYVIMTKVNETHMILPHTYDPMNGRSDPLTNLIYGPSSRANIMSQERHNILQENINSLTRSCRELKEKLKQLLTEGKNVPDLAGILMQVMSIEASLEDQQKLLTDFNKVQQWSPPKQDYFNRDLNDISLKIYELIQRSLAVTQPHI